MQCPQISDEKNFFASLTNNFWSFKKRIKNFHQQNLYFFHQKSEGIAFIFCMYLYQNMRAFIFCRYCPPIVFCPQIWKTKKSSKIEGNTLGILRRSFFPFNALGMPSFNNSVQCKYMLQNLKSTILYQNWYLISVYNRYPSYYLVYFVLNKYEKVTLLLL